MLSTWTKHGFPYSGSDDCEQREASKVQGYCEPKWLTVWELDDSEATWPHEHSAVSV